ncbi:Ribosome maturation factor RimP [bacterium HR39]|nr:Ribosome maturation factor RimP [bacterium HR39]
METGAVDLEAVRRLIEPTIEALGYEIVQIRMLGGRRPTLQIMAEPRDPDRPMTVADCAEISNAISPILDVADPIPGSYHREVSSPGIDRPLTRPTDYERFAGFEARIETDEPVEGRRRFRGRLLGLSEGRALIEVAGERFAVPLERIQRAKLVLTDELIEAERRRLERHERGLRRERH